MESSQLFAAYSPRRVGEPELSLPEGFGVRQARPEDLNGITRLTAARNERPYDQCVREVQTELELSDTSTDRLLLAALVNDALVGFGRVRWVTPLRDASDAMPAGWYLMGVIVDPAWRRRGVAAALTSQRLAWIAQRADRAYYFVNSKNRASIDLHARLGFVEIARDISFPGVTFSFGGTGPLFRVELPAGTLR